MKVLLIAPLDPIQIANPLHLMGGENTYTRLLLAHPPKHITFEYFEEALKNGNVQKRWTYYLFVWLQKFRLLPPGARVQSLIIRDQYDLIYSHVYPVHLVSQKPITLVISDSSSNSVFIKKYLLSPDWLVNFWKFTKSMIFRHFYIIDSELHTSVAKGFFVFSKWARKIKNQEFGIQNCKVIYPGLPSPKVWNRSIKEINEVKLLFIGIWFERKGGRILLKVFQKLRAQHSHVTLTIVGTWPQDIDKNKHSGITHFAHLTSEKIHELYRTHDILVHIPPKVEGYGMVVVEAMSNGLAVVVSNIGALGELVIHRKSGLVIEPGSEHALEKALMELIKYKRLRISLGKSARQQFIARFSLPVFQKELTTFFNDALKK